MYRGTWRGVLVAVKELHCSVDRKVYVLGDPSRDLALTYCYAIQTLMREINIWKSLRHPCVLAFYGCSPSSDPPFLVCEYKSNGNAREYLKKTGHADRRQLVSDLRVCRLWESTVTVIHAQQLHDASLGLEYLHTIGVIHGDLKAVS